MEEYNLLQQLLSAQQPMPQGQGMLYNSGGPNIEITKKVKQPVQPELAQPIVAAFQPRQKFPTSAEEFNMLIQRQTEGLAGQREGLKGIESQIAELEKPQGGTNWAPLIALSDLMSGTKNLQGYQTPEQKDQARKAQALALKMGLQKSKNELTDKEIDLFKAQYQDSLGREKMAMEEKLAKLKLGADAGMKLLPGQEAADKAFGKEYQDWNAQGGYAGVEKQLTQLEEAAKALEDNPALSGGASTALPDAVRRRLTPEAMMIEQNVKQATQAALRQTLGSQFTEREGADIMQRSYDPALPAEENIKKIRAAVKELKTRALEKERASKYFESTGGTLKGLDATGNKQAAATPKTQLAPPAIGEVRGGFKFKGGNPADKNSWEKQ